MLKTHQLIILCLFGLTLTACQKQREKELPQYSLVTDPISTDSTAVPATIARSIIQDSGDNIWIAAFDGIYQFDGEKLMQVTPKTDSLRFFSVLEDRHKNIWFGAVNAGVYFYDGRVLQNFTVKDGLPGNRVTEIYEDRKGMIWFGTESGASRYDGQSFHTLNLPNSTLKTTQWGFADSKPEGNNSPSSSVGNNEINAIFEDQQGRLWVASTGHTMIFDGKTFSTLTFQGQPFTNVRDIIEDKIGNIWLGGNDGLWKYDGSIFTQISSNFTGYIKEDQEGNIWTTSKNGTGNWLLSRYRKDASFGQKPLEIASPLASNAGMLFGVLADKLGVIWVGTLGGVIRYRQTDKPLR